MNRGRTPAARPPIEVRRAFGASGTVHRFTSGEGSTFRVGELVLKPAGNAREAEWNAEVLSAVVEDGFRVARPVASVSGAWVHDGWTAWQRVPGRPTRSGWDDVITAGLQFHRALCEQRPPPFVHERRHRWAIADRAAFGDEEVAVAEPIQQQIRRLQSYCGTLDLGDQVIHGDLTENVLFAAGSPPAIIDFSPYYRPVGYATAIVAVDAIVWFGAPLSLSERVEPAWARVQLLARASIFRLVAASLGASGPKRVRLQAQAHAPLVDYVTATR